MLRKRKGITLIELVAVVACISLVFLIGATAFGVGINVEKETEVEFDLQTAMSYACDQVTTNIRYSTGVFVLPESSFNRANIETGTYLTAKWNYFGIEENSNGEKEIVNYVYNEDSETHDRKVVVSAMPGFEYDFVFTKNEPIEVDKLIQFDLTGYKEIVGEKELYWELTSEVEALNALQIVDWSTSSDKGRAIAYRGDTRGNATIGRIVMAVDVSGSMKWDMDGNDYVPEALQRVTIMKKAAEEMVQEFAKNDGIEVCVIPFSTTANGDDSNNLATFGSTVPIYNTPIEYYDGTSYSFMKTYDISEFQTLTNLVGSLNAIGGTNTGDGLRRAYHVFKNSTVPSGMIAKDYIVLLVDGDSTYASFAPYHEGDYFDPKYKIDDGPLDGVSARYSSGDYDMQVTGNFLGTHYSLMEPYLLVNNWNLGGIGSTFVPGVMDVHSTTYVKITGEMIRNIGAEPFVIAVSSSVSTNGHRNIQEGLFGSTSNPKIATNYFIATDTAALQNAFSKITDNILEGLWYLDGPKQTP